ncbi:hypothetical protein H4R34_003211 [Dimargaris verticillata]|uniref:2-dehydropantoate 2-reductase n=1 Tax=Dimargaris verticillata TaxID=2761393 RepID=A0A9W8B2L2_9FUNG|nr:hypothetical protein H4R34_003211 [Dimargaris verticillata]
MTYTVDGSLPSTMGSLGRRQNVIIVGMGAVGTVLGLLLKANSNCHVTAVCRSNYEAAKSAGIRVVSNVFGDTMFKPDTVVRSSEDAAGLRSYDFVVLTTKVLPNLIDQSELIAPVVGKGSVIVVVQNGLQGEAPLRARFPGNLVLPTVIYVLAARKSANTVEHKNLVRFYIGPDSAPSDKAPSPTVMAPAKQFVEFLKGPNVEAVATPSIQGIKWFKMVWNGTFNPISVLSGLNDTYAMTHHPQVYKLLVSVARELWATGEAVTGQPMATVNGVTDAESYIQASMEYHFQPSMLQDYLAGRPMEIDALVKQPLELARKHNVPTPHLETVYCLITMVQDSHRPQSQSSSVAP